MASGEVSVNSDVVNNALSYVVNSCGTLEGSVSSKLPGNFECLAELDLFSEGLTKLSTQVKEIISTEKSIISTITEHLSQLATNEEDLYQGFNNGVQNYNNGSNNNGPTGNSNGSDTTIDEENDGKKIKAEELINSIKELDANSLVDLLNLINVKKDEKTQLVDMLFDTSNSEKLFTIIKELLKDQQLDENISLEDYKKIQKTLLNKLMTADFDIKGLTDNSILTAKEYLVSVAKQNNISPEELIIDSQYRNTLKTSLMKLYDGDGISNVKDEEIKAFRAYIDKVAKENDITVEDLFNKKIDLII